MSWVGELMLNVHHWWAGVEKIKSNVKKEAQPLRIGVLGAAAINYCSIIDPIQTHSGTVLAAIAARDIAKAQAQIAKYKLASETKAYGSYDELINDPEIDAVYIPLPNGLHFPWAIKSMQAGKHVLVEKPITSNAEQARELLKASKSTGKVALEAFHWRFHPSAHYVKSIIDSGKYGKVVSQHAKFYMPRGILGTDDIRFNYDLAGGSCMDMTYVFSACCYFASPDITKSSFKVLDATPRLTDKDKRIDEAMTTTFEISSPDQAKPVTCTTDGDARKRPMFGFIPYLTDLMRTTIELERAQIWFDNFVTPWSSHAIIITEKDSTTGQLLKKTKKTETVWTDGPQWGKRGEGWWTTYRYQLEAFVDMVKAQDSTSSGDKVAYEGPWMTLEESVKVMELIDQVYEKAGLPKRGVEET